MKRKDKVITILGLSVLMCSLFLVTIPVTAIAAEQDDYVLGIYGNANEDDTIDMRDLTYVKLIFFGKKPETELADAKYDGKINPLDFIQIKLIIVAKEKELTVIDRQGRDVMVKKPVERIVCMAVGTDLEVLRALNAEEKVVGVGSYAVDREVFFPELSKLPCVGNRWTIIDHEAIYALNPDLVIATSTQKLDPVIDGGISVASFKFTTYGKEDPKERSENVLKLGYIVDKEDEAKEFIDFIQDSEAKIYEKVKELVPEEVDRPKVYIEGPRAYMISGKNSPMARLCRLACGRNIGDEQDLAPCPCGKIDPEWVIDKNPDIIFKVILAGAPHAACPAGYETDDPLGMKELRDSILNRPELAEVNAVKNGQVYVMVCFGQTPSACTGIPYMAKAIYPDIFSDLDTNENHQQYLTEFQGLDCDLDEHGVFIYHPVYFPEGR